MKTGKITFAVKTLLVLVLIASVLLVGLVGCDESAKNFKLEDGTYEWTSLRAAMPPMGQKSYQDEVLIEKTGDIYYVTITILNNEKCTDFYFKRDDKKQECIKTIDEDDELKTSYQWAFTEKEMNEEKVFKAYIPKMNMTVDLKLNFDVEHAKKIKDTVDEKDRPALFA